MNYRVLHIVVLYQCFATVLSKTHYNRKLAGPTLRSIIGISAKACSRECDVRTDCLSYNYNRRLHLCELNEATYEEFVGNQPDSIRNWVFRNSDVSVGAEQNGNKTEEQCLKHTCGPGKVCIERTGGFDCVVRECNSSSLNIYNGTVYGNVVDVGAIVKVECDSEFSPVGDNISTCQEDGQWHYRPMCDKVCPMLNQFVSDTFPSIVEAVILSEEGISTYTNESKSDIASLSSIREDSVITLQCAPELEINKTMKIFCYNNKWSYSPGYFDGSPYISYDVSTTCDTTSESGCSNEICKCPFGTRYSYSLRQCVERCSSELADTFTKHENWHFSNYMDYYYSDSFLDCKNTCLSATYKCTMFTWFKYGRCYMYSSVYVDNPYSGTRYNNAQFYMRDCL